VTTIDREPVLAEHGLTGIPLRERQLAGLEALANLGAPAAPAAPPASTAKRERYDRFEFIDFHPGALGDFRHDGGLGSVSNYWYPPSLPPQEVGHGPLRHEYDIPDVVFRPRRALALIPLVLVAAGSFVLHDDRLTRNLFDNPAALAMWGITITFILVQLALAWAQKPFAVTRRQQKWLDSLYVAVNIPVYNEDPAILDRTIYSLFRQTRLPDHVQVVDDGSTVDYDEIRTWWDRYRPSGVRFTWVRQANAGKKHAQSVTFLTDHEADIFVTIDSDSALDRHAIQEGLKPFADRAVVSVAGLETAFNFRKNILTRAIAARSLAFQLFAMSAQSVAGGSVLINPGAFSLYWADLIRDIVPSYLGETFFGNRVTLGDDTALTLFALCSGKAVHQPSAVSMPVYPETVSHHLRQWTRWMRASTIRTFWRIRYLPLGSYGWLYVVYTLWAFFTSVAVTVVVPLAWPATRNLAIASGIAMIVWPLAIATRLATVRRSDQTVAAKLTGVLLLPVAALWYLLVLRQIRFYGMATCARQHWVTRHKVEVKISEEDAACEPVGA
jgi:hyaluronan synthase